MGKGGSEGGVELERSRGVPRPHLITKYAPYGRGVRLIYQTAGWRTRGHGVGSRATALQTGTEQKNLII